ncbi:hypothetical protein ABW19_dt0203233 [Dactylella cylindrospora]|nr:hypothetical protein ABW19_dt0203233 [Dactylella cylindrospora]
MGHPPPEFEPLPDWYKVLELTREASSSAIRAAYKRLAFQYHPDKTLDEKLKPEMTRRFTEIQEAYEVLSDSRRRDEYDEELVEQARYMEEEKRRERSRKSQKAQHRHREEARMRKEEDKIAEMEYILRKKQEDDLLQAAMAAQQLRKQHAETERQKRKDDERRARQDARKEEAHRRDAERREQERMQREEERKQHARDNEKRTRDRKQDRKEKDSQQFPIDDILDTEPLHFDRTEKSHDRGRASRERLRDPLNIQRDRSKGRDRSQQRDRDHESEFSTRQPEKDRKNRFYDRRMSTEPVHEEDYLRAPGSTIYGSPPHSYSKPRSSAYTSPPPSPRQRHSNPSLNSSHFKSNSGRARTRDQAGSRKHSEAGLFSRDSFPSSIPEDINTSIPGNRDSGYSTSSAGTPLRSGVDARMSTEKLDNKTFTDPNGKKYKVMYVSVSDDDDDTSTIGKSRSKRATKQTSRESYAPRHQPPVELDDSFDDPFRYMTGGSKSFSFSHKEVNYSAKPTVIHTRTNSDLSSPPDITIENFSHSSAHKSRHVPPVGAGGTPSLGRYSTWAG